MKKGSGKAKGKAGERAKPTGAGKAKGRAKIRAPRIVPEAEVPEDRIAGIDATPVLTGGDLDADWQRAGSIGEEAVGGSVATPDQDEVDEIARALGVERDLTSPVVTTDEILRERDERRWELERRAARDPRDG
jgi:Family of unknown function (DUF6335)